MIDIGLRSTVGLANLNPQSTSNRKDESRPGRMMAPEFFFVRLTAVNGVALPLDTRRLLIRHEPKLSVISRHYSMMVAWLRAITTVLLEMVFESSNHYRRQAREPLLASAPRPALLGVTGGPCIAASKP